MVALHYLPLSCLCLCSDLKCAIDGCYFIQYFWTFNLDWIILIFCWLVVSISQIGHDAGWFFNQSGLFHHKLHCFNSLLDNPLLTMSGRFSFSKIQSLCLWWFLFFCFVQKQIVGFCSLAISNHCESFQILLLVCSKFSSLDTKIWTSYSN